MFKNRKSTLLAKKSSDLTTIRETVSDATAAAPSQKVRRLESGTGGEPITETDDPFGSSQFSVPASQMNSQRRYLSQRSNLQKSQSARTSRRMPTNYFESVLLKCQLDLDDPTSIVLRCEPIAFVRTLRGMLQGSPDYPRNVKDFLAGVEQVSKTRDGFRKMLECCQMQNPASGDMKPIQESVLKMLLCVEFMQEDLIRLLFEYVERVADEEAGVNMVGLVLSQIKFIDQTVHGTLVFNKYFEVLERSKNVQLLRAAVGSLEDVIDVAKQDMAFRRILELFPRMGDLFTVTNVTVFCEMSLSGSTLRLTRTKMVEFVEGGCPVEVYPVLVRFMLKFNSSEIDGLHENIQEIRQVVDGLVRLSSGEKYLREVFQIIYQALTVSAVLYEAWIKFFRLLTDEESHMALDLLVLLMMLTVNEIKSATIQKILLNKIKKGHLTISHMKQLTKQFGCVLTVHMDCVLDFVESCLKERQTEVCEFGVLSMSYLFSANNLNNRLVLNKLVGFMSEMALINEGHRNDHLISICMNALSSIYRSYPSDIRNNAHILLKIMDISMDLNLQQYRTVVSLICEAIHVPDRPLGDNETWDSLNIVIKKQLLSNSKDVKKKGIIGVVRLIRHLLKTSSTGTDELPCSFDSEKTIDTVSDIPTASGREIGNMINLLFTSSNESTDVLALCYDELAEMLQDFERNVGKPEKAFTIWLCDVLTNEFQNFFIIEEVPQGDVVQFAKKLCINDTADVENTNAEAYAISVNIAENMLAYNSRYSSMCFFLAMFKLMKALQMIRYDGNLESINALLGCAIVVPSFYDEPDEKHLVETFEEDVCRQLLDAYFYIANWFRELINAFIHQTDPLLHRKVLERLTALVQLERRLAALLRTVDFDYYPPICNFSAGTQSKSSRAAKESSSKQNVTLNATKTQLDATAKPRSPSTSSEFDGETLFSRHRHGFRTMDNQVIQLFRESVLLCRDLPAIKVGECLGLTEYRFLLETFTIEVESKADPRANQQLDVKLDDLLTALPFAVENYLKIKAKRKELHASTDPDSQTEYKALTCCSNLSLRLFTGILLLLKTSPSNLQDNALKAFVKLTTSDEPTVEPTERILTSELTHKNAFKDLHNAHCLFKFGCALNSVFPAPNNPSTIATFCQKFICSHFAPKTGTAPQLTQLLQGLFTVVDLTKIKRLTKALADDLTSPKTDEKLFSGLQRAHYSLLFKELTKSFIKCIQTELRSRRTTVQKFVLWEQSSEILKQFAEVAKQADNLKIYSYYMKYSHTYLKLFQQSGLRTLEDVLKVSADRVSHLLGTLQHGTRYLHNICCHSKNIKDNSLAAQIPFIRETVETLIYSVKAVLAANDCASVFWMGNLKNKDLKGDLIISQHDEAENELEQDSDESDIEDFLSDDEGENRPAAAAVLSKSGSGAKSSQSKCF